MYFAERRDGKWSCSALHDSGRGPSTQMPAAEAAAAIPPAAGCDHKLRRRQDSQVFDRPASPTAARSDSSSAALPLPVVAAAAVGLRLVKAAADGLTADVRKYLAAVGVDVNQLHQVEGHYYPVTALMMAAIGGHHAVMQLLLDAGAGAEIQSRYGTAFEMACRMEQLASLTTLASAGACLEKKDAKGQTRLMQAATRGKVDIVRTLLRAGASTETRDGHATPFIAACIRGHINVVVELVRAGCDVTATDHGDGATGMELATLLGHHQVVSWLQQLADEPEPGPEPELEPKPEAQPVVHRFSNTAEVAPGVTPLVRLAPNGSWALRSRDEGLQFLPSPEAQHGTILNWLTVGQGRARG